MAGAHDWQEPLTAPKQPPPNTFHFPHSPKTLPHSPTSPRPGLQPESGQNGENYLVLVYRGRGMPGMGQRISAMPRILRMRVSRVRAGPQPRRVEPRHQPDWPGSLPPSHAILLSLRPRVTRDRTPIFSKPQNFLFSHLSRFHPVSNDQQFLFL